MSKCLGGIIGCRQRQKALHGIQTGFPMVVTLAIGEYNPFKCHEDVLSLQPMIPPKRFDILIFSPLRFIVIGTSRKV